MTDLERDHGDTRMVTRTRTTLSFEHDGMVLMTQTGWRNGDEVVWGEIVITPMKDVL